MASSRSADIRFCMQRSQADLQHFSGEFAIAVHAIQRELDVFLLQFAKGLAKLGRGGTPLHNCRRAIRRGSSLRRR